MKEKLKKLKELASLIGDTKLQRKVLKYVKQQENLLNMTCINICEYMKNSNKYKNMFLKINYFYIKINK